MKKILVAYFSASGVTEQVAKRMAEMGKTDLFEIKPTVAYTQEDLNWMDKKSRSTLEMKDPTSRPSIVGKVANMNQYEVVVIGFPIWWYTVPSIIKTFLEMYNFAGKRIALFATSGGSGFGNTVNDLKPSVDASTKFVSQKLLNQASDSDIENWIKSL